MANPTVSNPFALMMNPQAVLQAVEGSERLGRLQRRVYRPLDKPLIAKRVDDASVTELEAEVLEDDALSDE